MELTLTITGRRCDLALHPVSAKTVERIQALGRKFYTKKYIHWWRNGNTSTCGMKFDDDCVVKVQLDHREVPFNAAGIGHDAVLLRRRHYLESKARYLALLGYDDEYCHMVWKWTSVDGFDPTRFSFFVHRWDRILGEQDFLILDDVRYDGAFADVQDWGGSCGFSLVDPRVIDLDELRKELGIPQEKPAPRLVAKAAQPVAAPRPAEPAITPLESAACDPTARPLAIPVDAPNAVGVHGCTTCKNSTRVELRIEDDVVAAAGGEASGCEYGKECFEALTRLVTGKPVWECWGLSNEDLRPLLPRVLPKLDCDTFTVGALKIALRAWEKRQAA